MSPPAGPFPAPDPGDPVRGRVVVITGASSGIGRATALAFAAAGAAVVGSARRAALLAELTQELERIDAPSLMVPADVTDVAAVERLIGAALGHFGRIDILVANAGVYLRRPIAELTVDDLERSMAVNFYGAVRPALAVLPHLLERGGGHLVFVSSMASRKGLPAEAPYVTAKWALTGFADVARQELKPHGIEVSTIMPGRVDTPFIADRDFHPISRPIPAASVANAILSAVRRRRAEVVVPRTALALHYAAAVSPGLADWGVRYFRLQGWPAAADERSQREGSVPRREAGKP